MTKILTKNFVAIIMVILCSFCIIAVPAYASFTDTEELTTDGASLSYLGDNDSQTRSISNLSPKTIYVYPARYVDGKYGYDPEWYTGAMGGSTSNLSCTVPKEMLLQMPDFGCDYFFNRVYFSVEGSRLSRVELRVDGKTVIDKALTQSGNYSIEWVTPKANSMYEIVVFSNNTNAAIFGQITLERYW